VVTSAGKRVPDQIGPAYSEAQRGRSREGEDNSWGGPQGVGLGVPPMEPRLGESGAAKTDWVVECPDTYIRVERVTGRDGGVGAWG